MSQEKQDILSYLKTTNRPYSANDIITNMNKGYGKTAVQRALDQLVEESAIREKIYGKQKVYSVLQNKNENISDMQKELNDLESEINKKSDCLKVLEDKLKSIEKEYSEIQSVLTIEEAEKKKTDLEEVVNNLQCKLTTLSENKTEMSSEERNEIKSQYEKAMKEYRKRKRICMDIINAILEGYPKPKKALFEELGIEIDDDNNVPVTLESRYNSLYQGAL